MLFPRAGRILVTRIYKNARFDEQPCDYERAYRLTVAEDVRYHKPKKAKFAQVNRWWRDMYPKPLPGKRKRSMRLH